MPKVLSNLQTTSNTEHPKKSCYLHFSSHLVHLMKMQQFLHLIQYKSQNLVQENNHYQLE